VSTGAAVEWSQFAYDCPAANADWKQMKSEMFRIGALVDPSQLA
jgi:hypothetical protein